MHIVKHEASSATDAAAVAEQIATISGGLDIVIANAAIGTDWRKTNKLDTAVLLEHFNVNVVGPIVLFERFIRSFLNEILGNSSLFRRLLEV